MGWMYLHNAPEKSHVIQDVTKGNGNYSCIKKSCVGNELWTIWQNKKSHEKFIVLFLLGKSDGNWGYKDISEEMGPCYYKCPLSFLEEVPVKNPDWRQRVVQHHKGARGNRELLKKLEVGKKVKLTGCTPSEFVVVSTKPLIGVADGMRYKLIKTKITEVE